MRKVLYLLGSSKDEDVEWLIAAGTTQQLAAGSTLIVRGQPTSALHIVLDDALAAEVATVGGKEVERLLARETVGEMSFLDALPPSATVGAREPLVVLALPHFHLAAKLEEESGFAARFYRADALFLSDRLRGKVRMLSEATATPSWIDERAADELDPQVLDNVYLAGVRFERMLTRLAIR